MSKLREAMIIAARDWCRERDMAYKSFAEATFIHAMMADFVLHMTGADAPELRYVDDNGLIAQSRSIRTVNYWEERARAAEELITERNKHEE